MIIRGDSNQPKTKDNFFLQFRKLSEASDSVDEHLPKQGRTLYCALCGQKKREKIEMSLHRWEDKE